MKTKYPIGHPNHPSVRDPEHPAAVEAAERARHAEQDRRSDEARKARGKYNQKLAKKKPAAKKRSKR